ncbi:MBOAT family O-acyltransferase [Virgibacillus ihumii]|uniref:MBOAT family O-acyltransferase n=1 Tax=Virgibacillus ihumii TaxID=2686091 RepID=UPI00157D0E06|nr:MBOAT family protein [Virgibacillus ihumii]
MVFSSPVFLFLFLPIMLLTYFLVPRALKNYCLLAGSLFFYAWGEPVLVVIMLLSIGMNYLFALIVDARRDSSAQLKWIMAVMIAANLGILIVFKYAQFLIGSLNTLLSISIEIPDIPLPIGISFFTFQSISYVIDVYRKDGEAQKNPFNVGLYISLFPQLIAGPIVRYQTIAAQIKERRETIAGFAYGIRRFIIGLGKKVIIADSCGSIADQIFAQNPADLSSGLAWIGIIAYTFQIYFDFSGYSDMAIGLARMFGFNLLENFNYPYISKSIGEFWRRWNISLGSWFRDYVYIPLGGNRKGEVHTYINLLIVWTLTGVWHGADWTFVLWGTYNGLFIMLEKAFLGKMLKQSSRVFAHVYAMFVVVTGFVFFRSNSFSYAFSYLGSMFGFNGSGSWGIDASFQLAENGIILVIALIASTPLLKKVCASLENKAKQSSNLRAAGYRFAATGSYSIVLLMSVVYMISNTFNPFIYFRF